MSCILLSVVGNTPQVVTETLYAIHKQGKAWPSEVRLITTTVGKKKAMRLIDEHILQQLCDELDVPCPVLREKDILVVPDAHGEPVADARTLEDHEALADFIVTQVRNLTDEGVPENHGRFIHASLAGGRKTMTFYLGYAMSLFGRAGDCLSHVLVSAEFENIPSFFYPTRRADLLTDRDGKVLGLDPAFANVELADIPFIRHRHSMPTVLKLRVGERNSQVKFRDLIAWINLGEQPEQLRLSLDIAGKIIRISAPTCQLKKDFQPGLLEFAFFSMVVRATLEDYTELFRPVSNRKDQALSLRFCNELLTINGWSPCSTLEQAIHMLQKRLRDKTLDSLKGGMKGTWFDQRINTLKELFDTELPCAIRAHVLPSTLWDEKGSRTDGRAVKSGAYGIALGKSQICIG